MIQTQTLRIIRLRQVVNRGEIKLQFGIARNDGSGFLFITEAKFRFYSQLFKSQDVWPSGDLLIRKLIID